MLRELRRLHPDVPVIKLTAYAGVEHAVEAMKLGTLHYVSKSFEMDEVDEMSELVEDAVRRCEKQRPPMVMMCERSLETSPGVGAVKRLIERVAVSPTSTMLLTGESGTGKDLSARAIHGECRHRDGPVRDEVRDEVGYRMAEYGIPSRRRRRGGLP